MTKSYYSPIEQYQYKYLNYEKAFILLDQRVAILKNDPKNEIVKAAVIQTFEFTFELAWKLIKSFLSYKGIEALPLPRDIIKLGFQNGLLKNGQVWLDALDSRNRTSHTYNGDFATNLSHNIATVFLPAFEELYFIIKKDNDQK
jgi:nucleotidyltransferase substrate binding protein (TIGR01987 family)